MSESPRRQRSILITGCSSGIGYASAKMLKERGWRVFASARQQADCDRLIGEGFSSPRIDYTDEATIQAAMEEVLAATDGTLDAVFNNGNTPQWGALEDIETCHIRAQFQSGFFGWWELTRLAIPVMRRQGSGRILFCSSVAGFTGALFRGVTASAKHAVEAVADTLRLELAGTDIHPVLIEPGPVRTRSIENALRGLESRLDTSASRHRAAYATLQSRLRGGRVDDWLVGDADSVASAVVKAVESPRPRPRYRITTLAHVAWHLNRILPTATKDWLIARGERLPVERPGADA